MSKPISIKQALSRFYCKIALDNMQNKSLDKPRSLLSDLLNDSPISLDIPKPYALCAIDNTP